MDAVRDRVLCQSIAFQLTRWVLATTLLLSICSQSLAGGGGAQNTVVVVNGQSVDSRRVANEYISLRNIPAVNVIVLNDVPKKDPISVDDFREKILKPLLTQISARRLHPQIDYVVYSTGFPSAIGVQNDTDKIGQELPQVYSKTRAAITTLTYFYEYSMAGNPTYIDLQANHYYRRTMEETLTANDPMSPDEALQAAAKRYEAGNYREALQAFEDLAKKREGSPALLYWQARCQAQLNNPTQTKALLEQVIKAGWAFHDDTLIDPAFAAFRGEAWFKAFGEQMPPCPPGSRPTTGFDARTRWTKDGLKMDDPKFANRYLISSMLAYTWDDFMTVDESIAQLRRTVAADFTHPKGTVYYMRNSDVRSKTREPGFEAAVADLKRIGINAKVVAGTLPENVDDIIGLMMGKSKFDWPASGSTIKPGAICENLTSYGGRFYLTNDPQTRLTEFLRAGAAGSSGTVVEPFAIQNKFPHPYIHVHYSRGASLGEAFFQSVHGPFQLLVVGDALCRPFATPLEFDVTGLIADEVISGPFQLSVASAATNEASVSRIEIYVDGLLQGRYAPGNSIELNSSRSQLANGFHELRVVVVDDTPIANSTTKTIPFYVGSKEMIDLSIEDGSTFKLSDKITGTMRAPNASRMLLLHNMEHLVDVQGAEGELNLDCDKFGKGPVKLQCVAFVNGQIVLSKRIEVLIE